MQRSVRSPANSSNSSRSSKPVPQPEPPPRQHVSRFGSDRNVWLATTRSDGRAHLAPVWFVFVDDRYWVCTGRSSVKASNLRRNHYGIAALEDATAPVVCEFDAEEHQDGVSETVVDAFSAKYNWNIATGHDERVGHLTVFELIPRRWFIDAGS